jgi:hypothetical protein
MIKSCYNCIGCECEPTHPDPSVETSCPSWLSRAKIICETDDTNDTNDMDEEELYIPVKFKKTKSVVIMSKEEHQKLLDEIIELKNKLSTIVQFVKDVI